MQEPVEREILLALWKIHILHHAQQQSIYGQWMLDELRRHGYRLSPGTLYPLLARMESYGWLRVERDPDAGPKERREYVLTAKGSQVLAQVRRHVARLHREIVAAPLGNARR